MRVVLVNPAQLLSAASRGPDVQLVFEPCSNWPRNQVLINKWTTARLNYTSGNVWVYGQTYPQVWRASGGCTLCLSAAGPEAAGRQRPAAGRLDSSVLLHAVAV